MPAPASDARECGISSNSGRWQYEVFQRVGGGKRDVRRRDALNRTVETPEALVSGEGGNPSTPAEQLRVLLHREEVSGFRHRTQNGLGVEGNKRAHVDHFGIDTDRGQRRPVDCASPATASLLI